MEPAKILLTGLPGCGKTTAVMKIVRELETNKAGGFYTREIRQDNKRKGFEWMTLQGEIGVLAHIKIKSRFKVGRYGVDVAGFEKDVVPLLAAGDSDSEFYVIDEIGKMECFSEHFVNAVRSLFESDKAVLATVAQKGSGFIGEVKKYPDIKLFNLNRENFERTTSEVLELLRGEQ